MAKKSHQVSMFPGGDDLPLFSGTAQRAENPAAVSPKPQGRQKGLPGLCPVCKGTGYIKDEGRRKDKVYCTCTIGSSLKRFDFLPQMVVSPDYEIYVYTPALGLIYSLDAQSHPAPAEVDKEWRVIGKWAGGKELTLADWLCNPGDYGVLYGIALVNDAGRKFTIGGSLAQINTWYEARLEERKNDGPALKMTFVKAMADRNVARNAADEGM